MNLFDRSGKTIAITGGAGVLGVALAKGHAEAGARVTILDLAEDRAVEVATGLGGEHRGAGIDVPVDGGFSSFSGVEWYTTTDRGAIWWRQNDCKIKEWSQP